MKACHLSPFTTNTVTCIVLLLLLSSSIINAQTLVVPPSPGSLSAVSHLISSPDYTVEVKKSGDANFTTCFVYKTDNYASNLSGGEKRVETAASFTNFSFSGTSVDVRITTNFTASSVTVRPLNYNITPSRSGNVITFTLYAPKKISIEVNNRLNPLFLFSDAPDVPNTGATYYYGPGVHDIGLRKVVNSNESVYIAGGAVVQGTFRIPSGSTNVEVRGRGIITNGNQPTLAQHTANNDSLMKYATFSPADKFSGAPFYNQFSENNLSFEGLIIANSAGWNFAFADFNHTNHDNSWRNIKEVQWSGCTDGIWFDGDNNVIDDCFIFNNDDLVTTHCSANCTVTNTTMWGGNWGGHLLYHSDYSSSTGVTYDNINVLGLHTRSAIWVTNASGNNTSCNNFTFRNIRIESHPYDNSYWTNKFLLFELNNNDVNNWLFENITIDDQNADEGDIFGTSTGLINGITFRNLKMAGTNITSLAAAHMDVNAYATNVTFALTPEINVKRQSTNIADNTGSYYYGSIASGSSKTVTFTVENKGQATLNLTGTPRVTVTGTGFSLVSDATTPVAIGGTTTFQLKFAPTTTGTFNGTVSIANNDPTENPYNFTISGTGTTGVNLITNPTFDINTTGWSLSFNGGGAATIASVTQTGYSGKAAKTTITNGGSSIWGVQIRQTVPVTSGKTYALTFKASADAARTMAFVFQQGVSPYTTWWNPAAVNLTATPTTFGPFIFNCTTTDASNLLSFLVGGSTTPVYIDDVVVTESTSIIELGTPVSSIATIESDTRFQEAGLRIYPNPAASVLKIDVPAILKERVTIQAFDVQGRFVTSNNFVALYTGKNTFEMNLKQFVTGTYFIRISMEGRPDKVRQVLITK